MSDHKQEKQSIMSFEESRLRISLKKGIPIDYKNLFKQSNDRTPTGTALDALSILRFWATKDSSTDSAMSDNFRTLAYEIIKYGDAGSIKSLANLMEKQSGKETINDAVNWAVEDVQRWRMPRNFSEQKAHAVLGLLEILKNNGCVIPESTQKSYKSYKDAKPKNPVAPSYSNSQTFLPPPRGSRMPVTSEPSSELTSENKKRL